MSGRYAWVMPVSPDLLEGGADARTWRELSNEKAGDGAAIADGRCVDFGARRGYSVNDDSLGIQLKGLCRLLPPDPFLHREEP